jgi:hypothetical protein
MHDIIGMLPHIIIIGMPIAIIEFMASQRSFIIAIIDASVGFNFIVMPSGVISQDIRQLIGAGIIIGIMPIIPIGDIIGIIPMPPIGDIIGIMFPIPIPIGIGIGIPIMDIAFMSFS